MSEQAKLPKGVERWTPKAEYQQTRGGFEKVATMAPDEEGYYVYLADLPAILAQRDAEWRDALLGDEAVEAAVIARSGEAYLDSLDDEERRNEIGSQAMGIEAAIDKAAPAEKVDVVEAEAYDALRDAVAKFLAVEYPFGFSDDGPAYEADRPAYELHAALLDADRGRE